MSGADIEIIEVTTPAHIEQFRALLTQYAAEREGGFSERMTQDLRDLPGRYAAPDGGFLWRCAMASRWPRLHGQNTRTRWSR